MTVSSSILKHGLVKSAANFTPLTLLRFLERAAQVHPSRPPVLAMAVVALPDPKCGEARCAFVEVKPGVSAEEFIAFCREHLARFKAPRAVVFGELPKTSTGKIQKFMLRDRARWASAIDT